MAWRRYPMGWSDQDFDDFRNEIWNTFNSMRGGALLPPGGFTQRIIPGILGEFRVDVQDHDEEVFVVADLPGVEKSTISLKLLNPKTLEICCERKDEKEEKEPGYFMRERVYGSMCRSVPLPFEVTDTDAKATYTNGVLEVRFKKINIGSGTKIEIE